MNENNKEMEVVWQNKGQTLGSGWHFGDHCRILSSKDGLDIAIEVEYTKDQWRRIQVGTLRPMVTERMLGSILGKMVELWKENREFEETLMHWEAIVEDAQRTLIKTTIAT